MRHRTRTAIRVITIITIVMRKAILVAIKIMTVILGILIRRIAITNDCYYCSNNGNDNKQLRAAH